ncbi:ATP-binding protein [Streptomyces mirabilis]|uniref:ATP-binding protein n=1 Tax=Streptomyces mirabilis TaxID=68239 RepID=UPI00333202B6
MDGLGHLELDRRSAEMLFQILTGRGERKSIAVASNEGVRGWRRTFTDPRLCAAIVDGPTFNAALSATGTEPYGLARGKANQAKQWSRPGSLRQRSHRWSQAPEGKDGDLRSSHCTNVRRGGRTTTRPWAF